jgi:hypothetical protein
MVWDEQVLERTQAQWVDLLIVSTTENAWQISNRLELSAEVDSRLVGFARYSCAYGRWGM